MTKIPEYDSLHQRGRAMEAAFFAQRDQKLLEALRRRLTTEEAEELLEAATGVTDKITIGELSQLSTANFLAVMGIFPLVAVAWCDRDLAENERHVVLAAARDMGIPAHSPAHQLLERWLETPPAENAMELWSDYTRAICATMHAETVQKLKTHILGRARKVALAAGGILGLGLGDKISDAEEACLKELERSFSH